MNTNVFERTDTLPMPDNCIRSAVSLIINIVGTVCEHESELTLMRLVNYMDLYRTYLSQPSTMVTDKPVQTTTLSESSVSELKPPITVTQFASFEEFVSDSQLLQLAATTASRECGFAVPTPERLDICSKTV